MARLEEERFGTSSVADAPAREPDVADELQSPHEDDDIFFAFQRSACQQKQQAPPKSESGQSRERSMSSDGVTTETSGSTRLDSSIGVAAGGSERESKQPRSKRRKQEGCQGPSANAGSADEKLPRKLSCTRSEELDPIARMLIRQNQQHHVQLNRQVSATETGLQPSAEWRDPMFRPPKY